MGEDRLRAAIVAVGNELLYGETVDTNSAWLGRELARRGVHVVRGWTVGDVDADIRDAIEHALAVADLVLVTGGLGPTPDDRTKAVVAELSGRPLVEDEGARRDVEARFRASGFDGVPPLSRSQYVIPAGAEVLRNPAGTAPGLLLEEEGKRIALFPGVPSELRAIVRGDFGTVLDALVGPLGVVHHRVVPTTGIFETKLAESVEPRIASLPESVREGIEVAYLPDLLGVELRLTLVGGTRPEADRRFDAWISGVGDALERWSFEAPSGDLAEAVVRELDRSGRTIAVAESCTGGLLGTRITEVPGASEVFLGGIIAYDNAVKARWVGVDSASLDLHGAVSEEVALELARGIAERFGADVGVGITGVAGPGGASPDKPVGTVWIGIFFDGQGEAFHVRFPGGRQEVRARAAQAALARVHRRLGSSGQG